MGDAATRDDKEEEEEDEEEDEEDLAPAPLQLSDLPFCLAFRGSRVDDREVLAVGLVNGEVQLHGVTASATEKISRYVVAEGSGSARAIAWADEDHLVSGYASGTVASARFGAGAPVVTWQATVEVAVTCCWPIAATRGALVAAGDDGGGVQLWDARLATGKAVMAAQPHDDYVSDLAFHDNTLLSCGADGRLCALEPRRNLKVVGQSDQQDDELLSIAILKRGKKVVCGTQSGALVIWNWGRWGDSNDRAMGHPESVDALLKVDEDMVCSGSSDGLLRVVRVQPGMELLGVLGDHDGFPVERLAFSSDKNLVASLSHDAQARALHATDFPPPAAPKKNKAAKRQRADSDSDDDDNSDDDDDSDDSDGDDDQGGNDDSDSDDDSDDSDDETDAAAVKPQPTLSLKTKAQMFFDGL